MKTILYSGGEELVIEYTQNGDAYEVSLNDQSKRIRLVSARDGALTLLVDGRPLRVHLASDGPRTLVAIEGQVYEFARAQEKRGRVRQRETGGISPEIRSPMPGKILEVLVAEDTIVELGQTLVVLEAMKMENALTADGAARIKKIYVTPGDLVDLGQLLVELEPAEARMTDSSSSLPVKIKC
jgi:biotin carboxyl carrier protein